MHEESGEGARLRVGPWVPDPFDGSRSGGHRRWHSGPSVVSIDAVGRRTDPLRTVDLVHAEERGWRRRHGGRYAGGRWLLVAAVTVGLAAVAAVPLLRAGHHATPPAAAAVPGAGAPVMSASDDPGPRAGPSASPDVPTPSAVPSHPAPRVPPPRPVTLTYEAEDPANTLGGTAWVDDYPGASGGRIVRNLGNWEGSRKAGTLRFNDVTVPRAGTYLLTFFYVHLDDSATRTAVIDVSGGAPVSVEVTGSATCCAAGRLRIALQRGVNTITFSNRDDHAPSLDKIVISSA